MSAIEYHPRSLRLDLLVRTSKRKKEARSPKQQREMAQACADTHSHEIVYTHDSGRDESGKTMDRGTLRHFMERLHAGLTDGLIVALTDRLGRAPIEEAMTFVRELDGVGVLVLADTGGRPIDLSDPMAETNLVMQLQFARQQWLSFAGRALRTKTEAIREGKFVGPTPLGYRRERGRLYIDEATAPLVREGALLIAREGIHACQAHLRRCFPDRRWDTTQIRRMYASRAYLGESRSGDELVNPNAHEPLLSAAEYAAAQTTPQTKCGSGVYPLSHVATCTCGAGLVGAMQTVRGVQYKRMRCSVLGKGCVHSVSAEPLLELVRATVKERLGDATFRLAIEPKGKAEAEQALKRAEWDRAQYVAGLTDSGLPAKLIAEGAARVQAAVERAERELHEIASTCARREDLPAADELDDDAKLLLAIRAGVSSIVVEPGRGTVAERLTVTFVDQLDDGLGVLAA